MRHPIDPLPAPAPRYQLRRMVLADLDELMVIEHKAFKHPWSEDLFRRELTHDWSTILVAEESTADGPRLLGFVIYWLVADEIHILNVASDPGRRRQGVARALLTECLAKGERAGARLATLEVRRSNLAALKLYESLAFRSVGIRPNYYADENEDAIVMVRDLP